MSSPSEPPPVCQSCGAQVDLGSHCCWNCGSAKAPEATAAQSRVQEVILDPPAGSPWVPRTFAAFALVVASVGGLIHLTGWLERGTVDGRNLPIWNLPGAASALLFVDALTDFLFTILFAGTALGALLVVVSWGLWCRRWWARRAVLGWCGLVVLVFGVHVLMAVRVTLAFE